MLMEAFAPIPSSTGGFSNTTAITITGTAATTTIAPAQQSSSQWRLWNNGSNTCFVNVGPVGAVTAAVIPVSGTPANGFPIAPGEDFIVTVPPQASAISVIGSAAGGTLYVTVGEGV